MSVQAMSWALTQQMVTEPHARHVLLCLANYANEDGLAAFPSVAKLGLDTGLSARTVQYRLRELEAAGVISRGNQAIPQAYIQQKDRIPVCYDLALERGAPCAPGARHDVTGCTPEHNGVHATTQRGAQRAPEPSYNHPLIINKPKERAGKPDGKFDPVAARPENTSEQTWAYFCEMRKAKRAPLTAKACANIAKKLAGRADADAILDRSITNSWSDVYPDSDNRSVRQGKPNAFNNLPVHDQSMYEEAPNGRPNF